MKAHGDLRDTFFQECEDLLEGMAEGLRQMEADFEAGLKDAELVNAVFRAVHSIKGGAGAFALDALVQFAHRFETVLDALRSGSLIPDKSVLQILLRAGDHLTDLTLAARTGSSLASGHNQAIIDGLAGLTQPATLAEDTGNLFGFKPMALDFELDLESGPILGYGISFRPSRRLYALGHDPAILFRALTEFGTLAITLDHAALPDFDSLDWEESYLGWSLRLETTEPAHVIEEVFEFVEGLCDLQINTIHADPPPSEPISPEALQPTVELRAPEQASLQDSPKNDAPPPQPKATVRVDLERVDRLINLVGELVINQAMLSQCLLVPGEPLRSELATGLDEFRNLSRDIQESVMAIRAQPIKPLFQRMSRILREASDRAGKSARLVTEGDATEVDKTVIEQLSDPLTHILRNAIDHGIETAEDRVQAGKPETGTIRLSAAHRSGRVVIQISDDGAGLNRAKVRSIAIAKGLIAPEAELSTSEIDGLLFLPGFSTAERVSELSGRGVGMDVVKRSVQRLGGKLSIQSAPGLGTTISISLPLTLAVLDGMVVEVAGQTMVVPITAIVETLRPRATEIQHLGVTGQVVHLRGTYIPVIDLAENFGAGANGSPLIDRVLLLVETEAQRKWALAVDHITDQRQVVIKGLEENYGHIDGIAAATIMGDGKIALILDPEEIIAKATEQQPLPAVSGKEIAHVTAG
jgi:two-component system, chemotaxis family, sensor kinase CheA